MTEPVNLADATDGASHGSVEARTQELARTLQRKVAEGYRVESQHETGAVVVMKGHKRWFGLVAGDEQRSEISIDEDGHAISRRI